MAGNVEPVRTIQLIKYLPKPKLAMTVERPYRPTNFGSVDMSYSAIGLEPGTRTDTNHCDMHFGGSGTTIKVTHSNISTSAYGLMLYGGNNVDLTLNNWFNNPIQIDTSAGVSGNITGGWFDKGAPTAGTGATLTYDYQNPVMTRLPDTMAGPQ